MTRSTLTRRLDVLERQARPQPVPRIPIVDLTVLVDEVTWAEFAGADLETREAMRRQQIQLEAELIAEATSDLPEPTTPRAITAIVITSPLPAEDEVYRLVDEEPGISPDRQAAIERRDRIAAESAAEARREQAVRLPLAERDWDPSGPDDEVLYIDMPAGWPVTRAVHRARLEAMGG